MEVFPDTAARAMAFATALKLFVTAFSMVVVALVELPARSQNL